MNFLAHAYLAAGSDESILGGLMGDFVKGPLDGRHGPEITRGLFLHRHIDTYTDAHPVVAGSRTRVSPVRRRYAGILVDLFYDHFLARHWSDFSDLPLEGFTERVYAVLRQSHALLPARLQSIAPRMASADWLASYRRVDAIGVALDRIGERLKRGNALLGSGAELTANYDSFEADFRRFFPDVVVFVREHEGT